MAFDNTHGAYLPSGTPLVSDSHQMKLNSVLIFRNGYLADIVAVLTLLYIDGERWFPAVHLLLVAPLPNTDIINAIITFMACVTVIAMHCTAFNLKPNLYTTALAPER